VFRYRLRTLLIVLTLGPAVLAGAWLAWPQFVGPALVMSFSFAIALLWAAVYHLMAKPPISRTARMESRHDPTGTAIDL
jgi:hypothetical protein